MLCRFLPLPHGCLSALKCHRGLKVYQLITWLKDTQLWNSWVLKWFLLCFLMRFEVKHGGKRERLKSCLPRLCWVFARALCASLPELLNSFFIAREWMLMLLFISVVPFQQIYLSESLTELHRSFLSADNFLSERFKVPDDISSSSMMLLNSHLKSHIQKALVRSHEWDDCISHTTRVIYSFQ